MSKNTKLQTVNSKRNYNETISTVGSVATSLFEMIKSGNEVKIAKLEFKKFEVEVENNKETTITRYNNIKEQNFSILETIKSDNLDNEIKIQLIKNLQKIE